MKQSVASRLGLNLAFWRALLPKEGFRLMDPPKGVDLVRMWWGEDLWVRLGPGDKVRTFPSPWGLKFDGVEKEPETVNVEEVG